MRRLAQAAALLAASAAAALAAGPNELAPLQSGLDYHSFANVEQFRVTHLDLDLRVDFTNKVLFGTVGLEIKRLDPRAGQLVLDTRDLDIRDVSEKATSVLGALSKSETTWVSRPFHLDKADPVLGSPLVIELPPLKKTTELIKIDYVTSPAATALDWLAAPQTAGKHHPFMYTLSDPIGARSWIPLQDTPQIRASYSALIHTPDDVIAVMSAKNDPKAKRNGEYSFVMPDPIPSRLLALAVGDLRFKELGSLTGVYAEKPLTAQAVKDFADADAVLRAGEKIFGPYRFDRFDLLVAPSSFPLDSVAGARLAFVSPTTLLEGRSPVVARSLAQSWTAALVSGAGWRDAWIEEGIADYVERRIAREVYGAEREAMDHALAVKSLRVELAQHTEKDQALAVDLRDRDPAAVPAALRAGKGGLLLELLDAKFGRERLDGFLSALFDHFSGKSVSTEEFIRYLQESLLDRSPGIVTREELAAWVSGPGIPAQAVLPQAHGFESIDAARGLWLSGKVPARKLDTRAWVTPQWLYFLDNLPATLSRDQLADLDQAFEFSRTANSEVAARWFLQVIEHGYPPSYPPLERYLETTARRSLVTPLYAELMKTPAGAAMAKRVYARAQPNYHPQTVASLDPLVVPAEAQDDE